MDATTRQKLINESLRVRAHAYAPFSKFAVGAALLTNSGQIFSGVNVENSSYGLTCCAERTAIFTAVTAGQTEFEAMAIASPGGHAPCGACRQVMVEFAGNMAVILVDADDPQQATDSSVATLLPASFRFPDEE
jgi:cytidine deaminase